MPKLSPQSLVKKLTTILSEAVLPGGAELQSDQRAPNPSGDSNAVIVRRLFLHVLRTVTHAKAIASHGEGEGCARLEGWWSKKLDPQQITTNIGSWPPASSKWATH